MLASMKINRRGAARNEGWKSVEINQPDIEWDEEEHCIRLSKRRVKDFGPASTSKHHYRLEMSLEEIAKILACLGAGLAEPKG
jgi:hypothetical protein